LVLFFVVGRSLSSRIHRGPCRFGNNGALTIVASTQPA
jgi:hypothetical protein